MSASRNFLRYHGVAENGENYSVFVDPSGGRAAVSPVAASRLGGHFLSGHAVAAKGKNYSVYVPPGGRAHENYYSPNEEEEEVNYSVYVPPPGRNAHKKKKGGSKQSRRNRRRSRRNRQSRRN